MEYNFSTNAQESFTYFQNICLNSFESSFPESTTKLNDKNRLYIYIYIWMPKSLIKCIERNHSLSKLSIMQPTDYNTSNYKKYRNKLTPLKRDLERKYYSDQLNNNKPDIKKSWNIIKSVIGKEKTSLKKILFYATQ